ncbi:sarcosine oxidase subunit delta [Salipiger mucosus]|uniref:Sarcosine oxidase delta subunit n=1 Tax=Salipiger mucosus DSM 16094 TaxID=1123237 RepID=S9RTM0_9RHOB|nr:sarcosine oxidase subunit delta [Salipiger mucosus]EPX81425.1 Sarcosine oxidase delta subunit [Salipiger mucosus DSM 16094]
MLILTCPCCGIAADETELSPGGEAHLTRHGPGSGDTDFEDYLFNRENARGVHFERWRHAHGCGKWFLAARDTVTMQVFGTYPAQTTEPPQEIRDRITKARPGWRWRDFGAAE